MAPEETMMTLCPSFLSFTAVSTIDVRMKRRGSWVFSSTMELVPKGKSSLSAAVFLLSLVSPFFKPPLTKFNDNPQRSRTPHSCEWCKETKLLVSAV